MRHCLKVAIQCLSTLYLIHKLLREQWKFEIDSCVEWFSSWPPGSEELINTKCHIPRYPKQLLSSLLSRKVVTFKRIKRLVSSIGQDIIYNVTRGKSKTQKYIQFGLLLKRKTVSKQINIWKHTCALCFVRWSQYRRDSRSRGANKESIVFNICTNQCPTFNLCYLCIW